MLKPLNQFNAMLDEIIGRKLSGSEQLVLLHLYNAFNRAHWAETIHLSDESLRALMNLYDSNGKPASIETVRRAKQKLKSKGLIDFTSGKGSQISEYKLVKWYSEPCGHPVATPADTVTDTPKDTPEDALIKYTLHRGNQEDVKTVRREDRTTTTTTRAREGEGKSANPTPNIKVGQNSEVKVKKASATVVNCWRQATYMNPTELDEKGLAELEKEFGTEKVYAAIIKANRHKDRPQINLAFVETVLRSGEKPPKVKGEVRSVRDNRNEGDRERGVQRDNGITTDYDAMFGFDD